MSGIHANLAVGIPACGRPVVLDWMFPLLTQNWPMGINVAWISVRGANIAAQRIAIVENAKSFNAKYLWFVDDDTAPPTHAARYLIRELEANPSAAICAGIYCTKVPDAEPLVWRRIGDLASQDWRVGEVFPCEAIGTGCMMIRMSVFETLPRPWFQVTDEDCVRDDRDPIAIFRRQETEDTYFCRSVTAAGHSILAHGGVLCVHWDTLTGTPYALPLDSWPARNAIRKEVAAIA